MILGLSHIAFSSADIDAASARLAEFGYVQRFDDPALENHSAKRPFLSHHLPRHHIRALAADGAMAIELLYHGALAGAQAAAMLPVFRSDAPCPDWHAVDVETLPIPVAGLAEICAATGAEVQAFHDPALAMTLLWAPRGDGAPGLYACALPSAEPGALRALLGQLRFRPDAGGKLWSLLTPLPALQARVIPVASRPAEGWAQTPCLDAPGCACLALMARGTGTAPLPIALQENAVSFSLAVNGKDSRITLARPDHGPIIELVDQPT